jgi:hypothetical protein
MNSVIAFSSNHSIDEIRKKYQLAVYDSKVANSLADKLSKIEKPDALTLAYKASTDALKAKHAWSPYAKLDYMNSFDKFINEAISMNSDDIEIRFLRYSVQLNTPKYLGLSKNLTEDKSMIVNLFLQKKFKNKDKVLITEIFQFMLKSKVLSDIEREKMLSVLKSI